MERELPQQAGKSRASVLTRRRRGTLTAKQTEIHGSQMMKPNDLSDWLTFHLMPPLG